MNKPALLVMAAGVGKRYGGLKQIDPVGPHGEIVIDYSIYDAKRAGFEKVVFVIRREFMKDFRKAIGDRIAKHIAVDYAFQELSKVPTWFSVPETRKKPWGTTQAVLSAAGQISEPFAVINADDYYGVMSYMVLADRLRIATDNDGIGDYSMVGFVLRNTLSDFGTVTRGVCKLDAAGMLAGVNELTAIVKDGKGAMYTDAAGAKHKLTGAEVVSMNFWGFTRSMFGHCARIFEDFLKEKGSEEKTESVIPGTVDQLIREKKAHVSVLHSTDAVFGVNYKEDKLVIAEHIRTLIANGTYPDKLWS